METNLKYYENLRQVPREAQKQFNNGRFNGTDINPMWRIKRMTEIFGPCGIGWYSEVVHRELRESTDGKTLCAFIGLNVYIKVDGEWSKPIYGEGGNTMSSYNKKWDTIDTSDEAYKMAYTDAFSNATKQLGLGADIWFSNDQTHATKYDLQQERKNMSNKDAAPVAAPAEDPKSVLGKSKSKKELRAMLTKNNWTNDKELVEYAKTLSTNLPEE